MANKKQDMITREIIIEGYEVKTLLSRSELPYFEASVEKLNAKVDYYKERFQALHPSKIILLASLSVLMEYNKEFDDISRKLGILKKKMHSK